jgi:hypothetical protein
MKKFSLKKPQPLPPAQLDYIENCFEINSPKKLVIERQETALEKFSSLLIELSPCRIPRTIHSLWTVDEAH